MKVKGKKKFPLFKEAGIKRKEMVLRRWRKRRGRKKKSKRLRRRN